MDFQLWLREQNRINPAGSPLAITESGYPAEATAGEAPTVTEVFVTNLIESNTFVTELVENNTFITELVNNEFFITELTENNTYVTQITQVINQVISGKKGQANELATLDGDGKITASQLPPGIINFSIDGGGSAITTGVKGYAVLPYDCTVTGWQLLADQAGSIVVDIWRDTYANHPPLDADSITASATPSISGAVKNQSTTLTGWTTQLNEGDILVFNVDSASAITSLTVALKIEHR